MVVYKDRCWDLCFLCLFISDLSEHLPNNSALYLYADDTKIFRGIGNDNDWILLKEDMYAVNEWTEKWLLKFHADKCKTMHLGRNENPNSYKLSEELASRKKTSAEKHAGVFIDDTLSFDRHLTRKINEANSVLGAIRRFF